MTSASNPERIIIQSTTYGLQWETKFFLDIQEAFVKGYRIAETDLREDMSMRNFNGNMGRVVMYLEGCQPEKWKPAVVKAEAPVEDTHKVKEEVEEVSTGEAENAPVEKELTLLEKLEGISDYKSLKAFAEVNEIELPAKTYNPKAVKKAIKKALEAKA